MDVLVAEDDPTSRALLRRLLTGWDFSVREVEDGTAAWEALCGTPQPSLAVLDWMMPGLDGPEVCRKVRELDTDSPPYLILVTGRGASEDVVEGLDAGADDYLTKPFDRAEFRARLAVGRRVMELRHALSGRVKELAEALEHVKTLQGLLPICMHCHKVRDDRDVWDRMENYIEKHSELRISHSLCPDCLRLHYPEYVQGEEGAGGAG